ncbi:hypothetical protein K469DRAFT_599026, partial [Zopfia rhizophila CBS 207.26]
LLDFPRYKEWHAGFINYIETNPPDKPASSLVKGDTLRAGFSGTNLQPTITNNTPIELRWFGSWKASAFAGEQYFGFEESKITPMAMTFIHGEKYTAWLSMLFKPGWPLHSSLNAMYTQFAQDLKARVEANRKEDRSPNAS